MKEAVLSSFSLWALVHSTNVVNQRTLDVLETDVAGLSMASSKRPIREGGGRRKMQQKINGRGRRINLKEGKASNGVSGVRTYSTKGRRVSSSVSEVVWYKSRLSLGQVRANRVRYRGPLIARDKRQTGGKVCNCEKRKCFLRLKKKVHMCGIFLYFRARALHFLKFLI